MLTIFNSMRYENATGEILFYTTIAADNKDDFPTPEKDEFIVCWLTGNDNHFLIDGKETIFGAGEIFSSSGLHHIQPVMINSAEVLVFNKPFLCMLDLEEANNIQALFYHGSEPAILKMTNEKKVLQAALHILKQEFATTPTPEVVQMLLNRVLMLCARLYQKQHPAATSNNGEQRLYHSFYRLVEQHFRHKHSVREYASLLNKSPKTICNAFRRAQLKPPLQCIQERLHLEARRLLKYTNQPVSQISFELGFADIYSFSRFYKNKEGISPSKFRRQSRIGNN